MKKITLLMMLIAVNISFSNISEVLEKVMPSVVTVAVKEVISEEVYNIFGFAIVDSTDIPYSQILEMTGVYEFGSGFVIKRKNSYYIITNAHVIQKASNEIGSIVVYSINQKEYRVKLLGGDTFYDIAVLEFIDKPGKEINALEFTQSEPRIGETVYAIGNPWGDYPYTVTEGIISAKNRFLGGLTAKYGYLQTTASLAPGNSGGPLINSQGEIVGINTRGLTLNTIFQIPLSQFNFALEARIANRAIDEIVSVGKVRRCYLGIIITQNYIKYDRKKIDKQPKIFSIVPGSPAEKMLKDKIGAEILAINGINVRNIEETLGAFEEAKPNSDIKILLSYNNRQETITIKATEMTDYNLENIAYFFFEKYLGMTLIVDNNKIMLAKPNKIDLEAKGNSKHIEFKKNGVQDYINKKRLSLIGLGEHLWVINSIKDIALAIRLSLIYGEFTYVLISDGLKYGHRDDNTFELSDEEIVQTKALIY